MLTAGKVLQARTASIPALAIAVACFAMATSIVANAQVDSENDKPPVDVETDRSIQAESDVQGKVQRTEEQGKADERDTSPYDYRSSEEISEDRSVSFPVDI